MTPLSTSNPNPQTAAWNKDYSDILEFAIANYGAMTADQIDQAFAHWKRLKADGVKAEQEGLGQEHYDNTYNLRAVLEHSVYASPLESTEAANAAARFVIQDYIHGGYEAANPETDIGAFLIRVGHALGTWTPEGGVS